MPNLEGIGLSMPQMPIFQFPKVTSDMAITASIILLVATILFLLFKMIRNRILVEILERVHGGPVVTTMRGRVHFDKSMNMTCIRPMFGNLQISSFPFECFQKTQSIPIIGVNRTISLVQLNKHSYAPVIPPQQMGTLDGTIKRYDVKGWLKALQMKAVKKHLMSLNWILIFAVLSPLVIILTCVVILAIAMFTQATGMEYLAKKIDWLVQVLGEVMKSKVA